MEVLHTVGLIPPFDVCVVGLLFLGSIVSGIVAPDRDQRASASGITCGMFIAVVVGMVAPMVIVCAISATGATLIATMSSRSTAAFIVGNTNGASAGLLTGVAVSQYGTFSPATGELLILWILLVCLEYVAYYVTHFIEWLQSR
jgi:hypothetical protein